MSITAGFSLVGIALRLCTGGRYVAKNRRKLRTRRSSAKVFGARLYGRYKEITAGFEEALCV